MCSKKQRITIFDRRIAMKKKEWFILVSLCCMMSFSASLLFAMSSTRNVCNSYCEQSKSKCNGGALMNSDGHLEGCTKSGEGCSGTCYTCASGASNSFCARDGSGCPIPTTNPTTVSCGGRISGTCGGTWSSGCSCTAGTGSPSGSCSPVMCYIS
jgi:hypothetical protein